MQKTWDANNRGSALRALLVILAAVSVYLLVLQLSVSAPAFCDTVVSTGPSRVADDSAPEKEPQDKPAEDESDSINNAASIDFLCSAEVRSMLSQMYDYERNGNWAEAIKLYQDLLSTSTTGDCVPSDNSPEIYVGLRGHLHGRVLKYPQKARDLYLVSFAAGAQRLLEAAVKNKRVDLLQRVADRYLLTESGIVALDMLAGYAQERGNFMEAAYYLERLAEFSPNAVGAGHLVRMVRCYAALSESERAEAALARIEKDFPQTDVIVGGKRVNALEYARGLAEAAAVPEGGDENWLVAGGDDSGQSQADVLAEAGKGVWVHVMDVPNTHSARYPVVKDNIVYINSGRDISAYSLLDGRGPIWKFSLRSSLDGTEAVGYGEQDSYTRRHPWPTAITIQGHRLYSAIFGVLFCLNVQTGEMLWIAEVPGFRGSQIGGGMLHVFATAPLLSNGNMYTCAVTQDLIADDAYTLYCHDALTGAMKWRQDFCQVSRTGSVKNAGVLAKVKAGFAMPAVLRKGRGMVYVSTNAGVVAAIDSRNGEIAWLTRYDRGPGGDLVNRLEEKWAYGLPVVARGKLFVTPQDSDRMYAFDLRTGMPVWFVDRKSADGNRSYLVAVDAVTGLVFLGGDTLTAYDMNGKKALEPVKVEGGVIGTGVLAGRDLVVPTGRGLLRVAIGASLADGVLKTTPIGGWENMLPGGRKFFEEAGRCSLSLVSGVMLVESGRNFAAVYDLQKYKEILRQKIADTGDDRNVIRLRMAEVLRAEGKADEALGEFKRALDGLRGQAGAMERFDEEAYLSYRGVAPSTLRYYSENLIRAREGLAETAYSAALNLLGQKSDKVDYQKLYRGKIAPEKDSRILGYLMQAGEYATTTRAYVDAQLVLLTRGKAMEDWQGCVDLLVDMAGRPDAGVYDFDRYVAGSVIADVALFASEEIDALLDAHGRELYEKYEPAADALLNKAQASGRPADYFEMVLRYPNSLRARIALLWAIERAQGGKNYRDMVLYAQEFLWRYRGDVVATDDAAIDDAAINATAYMAEGYAALGMHDEAERTLADMRALARATKVSQVVVGSKTYGIEEFAAKVARRIADTRQYGRSSFGAGVLTVKRPIYTLSNPYIGEHVLLVPEGCAPEGMKNRVFTLQSAGIADKAVLTCVERETLQTVWRVVLPLEVGLPPDLLDYRAGYSGNNLVLVHRKGVMGLDPADGSIHWKRYFSLQPPKNSRIGQRQMMMSNKPDIVYVRLGHSAIIGSIAVYLNVPSDPTNLYALNSRTGRLLWKTGVGGEVLPGMTLHGEGLFVPILRDKKKVALVAVRRIDGAQMWRTEDLAFILGDYNEKGGSSRLSARSFGRLSSYQMPVEVRDAGSAGVLILSGDGLRLYKADNKPVWTNANIGRIDNVRCGGGRNIMPGPPAQHRILVGKGWCAVAAEEYTRIKVYDLSSGKLLQNLSAPQEWWISDWMADGERLHIFSHAWDKDGAMVVSARCFEARSGRMLYENIFQTGRFQYRPIVTGSHIVFIRGDRHGKSDKAARVYVYDKITGKVVASPVEIKEMDCDQGGQAIDTQGCILVKGRSKIVSLRITSKGN